MATDSDWLDVTVCRQWMAGRGIKAVELSASDGEALPDVTAGAHVDLRLPNGVVRQYSIMESAQAPSRYRIGVLRDDESRGGSSYVVDTLADGDRLAMGAPRNQFALDESGQEYVLVAGGIGITPLVAMARRLVALGKSVRLHYLVRDRERAAFLAELEAVLPAGALHLHVDAEAGAPDMGALVGRPRPGRHLYACGPAGLLDAIRGLAVEWPEGSVRFEQFRNAEAGDPAADAGGCRIELRRSGYSFDLDDGETVLDALARHQIEVPCVCREGVCGTCAVDVLEGQVEHRDALQSEEERARNDLMYVCVSRPRGPHLVLDL